MELALDQYFEAKQEGCVVRAKVRSLNGEGTKAAQWTRVVEDKRNRPTIRSLMDKNGRELFESKQMHAAFQRHFASLFRMNGVADFGVCLDGLPQISTSEAGAAKD